MKRLRTALFSLFALASAGANAQVANFSDIWWNPAEPGYGVQITQHGETAFVTLHVYDSKGRPTWFVAPDADTYALGPGGLPHFRGTLYRVEGSPYAGPFDPRDSRVEPVGELFLSPTGIGRILLDYSIDGTTRSAPIVRLTLESPDGAGRYTGTFLLRQSLPGGPPYGTREYNADFLLRIDSGIATLRVEDPVAGTCEYAGPYTQGGRFGAFAGAYTCSGGDTGTFEVSRLQFGDSAVSAQLTVTGRDGIGRGRFAAVLE